MSLKAKLEAVIYAAEEPVTLTQLAALFAADALEWKAVQEAAAAEQTGEAAGVSPDPSEPLPLLAAGLEYLGLADTPAIYASTGAESGGLEKPEPDGAVAESTAPSEPTSQPESPSVAFVEVVSIAEGEAYPAIVVKDEAASEVPEALTTAPVDAEAESKRLARQRDREVKAVLKQLLDELIAGYTSDARGVEIREIAGGYRMATKPECHDAVRLFVKSLKPPMKLSLPALETLAVIAYKQPVTAPEVNEIRGVESAGVLGSLLARKLIATAGRKQVIGRPILYKTTREFLLRFGLKDVTELPSMEEFEKMAATELEMEPEVTEADKSEEGDTGLEPNGEPDLESNSPSGTELAATDETLEDAAGSSDLAARAATEDFAVSTNEAVNSSPADSTATPAIEPTAEPNPTEAAPAKPDSKEQAEIEASPHGEKNQEEG
jgi:segregation and condensation protein B